MTREAIHVALAARLTDKLATNGSFNEVSRRLTDWTSPGADLPALFVVTTAEPSGRIQESPPTRSFSLELWVYSKHGGLTEAVPSTIMNGLLDEVDAAIAPDPGIGKQTLGGIVDNVFLSGTVEWYEGTLQEHTVVVYPIEVKLNTDNEVRGGQFFFESGYLYGAPTNAPRGGATNNTPIRFGDVRNLTMTESIDLVSPSTQLQYKLRPTIAGRAIVISAEFAMMNGLALNQVIYGQDLAAGAVKVNQDFAVTIPATPYQVTITPPSSGTFQDDLGIRNATTGLPMTLVDSSPAIGQYSRSGATYTFASADAAKGVLISYSYSVATGSKLTITNTFKDLVPAFKAVLHGKYNGRQMTVILNRCVSTSFSLPTTPENFAVNGFDFEAVADDSGEIGTMSLDS